MFSTFCCGTKRSVGVPLWGGSPPIGGGRGVPRGAGEASPRGGAGSYPGVPIDVLKR